MSETQWENHVTLRSLSFPLKVLSTFFLLTIGLAYLFALVYLYLIELEPHTKHGISIVQSVIIKYYGKRERSRIEVALGGSMGDRASLQEKQQIIGWIRQGAREAEFSDIQPILKRACAECHSRESGLSIPPLTSYAEVYEYTSMDFGESIKSLVRVSHIHLFGISFIFMLTSMIFAFSETSQLFRAVLIAIPFLAIWLDIGSWWFTKYQPVFAYTVIFSGIAMGLSLAAQITISLYEMWFLRWEKQV